SRFEAFFSTISPFVQQRTRFVHLYRMKTYEMNKFCKKTRFVHRRPPFVAPYMVMITLQHRSRKGGPSISILGPSSFSSPGTKWKSRFRIGSPRPRFPASPHPQPSTLNLPLVSQLTWFVAQ